MSIRELQVPPKKTSRQNSTAQINNILAQGVVTPQNVKIEVEEPTPSFFDDISDMMRGFGDCERPLRESVQLVEKIVQQQMRGILSEATEAAIKRRGTASPSLPDFEFLMRKHPIKINRMRKYLKNVRLTKRNNMALIQAMQQEQRDSAGGDANSRSSVISAGLAMNENGEAKHDSEEEEADLETFERYDEERMRRIFRADRLSTIFTGRSYHEYNECRKTSFYCRDPDRMRAKLKKFLNIPNDIRLSNFCLTILAYLIRETIATIVDLAILTRLNTENRSTDPFSRITSMGVTYDMPECPEVTQGRAGEGVKPITITEIQEGMRRHSMFGRRIVGFHRSSLESRICYLAL